MFAPSGPLPPKTWIAQGRSAGAVVHRQLTLALRGGTVTDLDSLVINDAECNFVTPGNNDAREPKRVSRQVLGSRPAPSLCAESVTAR